MGIKLNVLDAANVIDKVQQSNLEAIMKHCNDERNEVFFGLYQMLDEKINCSYGFDELDYDTNKIVLAFLDCYGDYQWKIIQHKWFKRPINKLSIKTPGTLESRMDFYKEWKFQIDLYHLKKEDLKL